MNGECQESTEKIKILVLGDSACGKTALLKSFAGHQYSEDYESTVFDYYPSTVSLTSGKILNVSLWDTSGSAEFDTFRPLAYSDTSVVILCYDIGRPHTLESIKRKWIPELEEHLAGVPKTLVGCKKDLRGDIQARRTLASVKMFPVPAYTGINVAKAIDAFEYFECSCKLGDESIKRIFHTIVLQGVRKDTPSRCKGQHSAGCTAKGTCQCSLF